MYIVMYVKELISGGFSQKLVVMRTARDKRRTLQNPGHPTIELGAHSQGTQLSHTQPTYTHVYACTHHVCGTHLAVCRQWARAAPTHSCLISTTSSSTRPQTHTACRHPSISISIMCCSSLFSVAGEPGGWPNDGMLCAFVALCCCWWC